VRYGYIKCKSFVFLYVSDSPAGPSNFYSDLGTPQIFYNGTELADGSEIILATGDSLNLTCQYIMPTEWVITQNNEHSVGL